MKRLFALFLSSLLVAGCAQTVDLSNVDEVLSEADAASGQQETQDESEPLSSANQDPKIDFPVFELSTLRESPDVCKIQENSRMRRPGDELIDFSGRDEIKGLYTGNATAFPFNPTTLPVLGQLHVSFIPVDWSDSRGTPGDMERYKSEAQLFADFWAMVSEGKLEIVTDFPSEWFRIPGSVSDFRMTPEEEGQRFDGRPKKQALWDAIVEASDPYMDFSNTHVAIPVWPTGRTVSDEGPHDFNFDWNSFMATNEGNIYDIAGAGDWFLDHLEYGGPWFYWVHEVGHMLGIPHQSSEDPEFRDESIDFRTVFWLQNPLNGYDVMGNQDGPTKTLSSWLRWLPGWLDDEQVICVKEDSIEDEVFELYPINRTNGEVEALVVKLSEEMVVVVESRRFDPKFDFEIPYSRDGLVVYTVDATKATSQGNMAIVSPRDITHWLEVQHWRGSETLDGTFYEGDSVRLGWLNIEAISIQNQVDFVRVTRTDEWVDPAPPPKGTMGQRRQTSFEG